MPLPAELFPEVISPKQVIFVLMTLGFLVVAIPAAIRFEWMDKVCIAGMLFMSINPIDVTFFSYTHYRGDIRGIEFGITDWLTITMISAMVLAPRWQKRKLHIKNPAIIWMVLYLVYSMVTIATALVPQFALFGVTKVIRAYATFWVAYNYVRSEDDLRFIVWCLIGITFYSFVGVLMDKYIRGIFPPKGSFPHQNSLSTFQNMLNFVIFAFLMQDSRKLFDKRTLVYWAAFGAGVLTTVFTLSRGGMATVILGCMMVAAMAFLLRQHTLKVRKKLAAIGLMVMLSIPVLMAVLPSVIKRFETAPEESGQSRADANIESGKMGHDYFFGVGLNNYSFAINYLPYSESLGEMDRGIAHHIFWLHYAEMGIVVVILFIGMTATFKLAALRFILRRQDSVERVVAIGILVALVITWVIGLLEWNWKQIQIIIIYFMYAGIVCSLDRVERERIRFEKGQKRKRALLAWLVSGGQRRVAGPAAWPGPGHHSR